MYFKYEIREMLKVKHIKIYTIHTNNNQKTIKCQKKTLRQNIIED